MESSFFFLRSPILPYDTIFLNSTNLNELFQSPIFKEAILFSSPDLFIQLEKLLNLQINNSEEKVKLNNSLYRFLLRMSYRSTPFGLFAGTALGEFIQNRNATIDLADLKSHKKNTRLDNHLLGLWSKRLENDKKFINELLWFSNDTVYESNSKIRYVEPVLRNGIKSHRLVDIDINSFIKEILYHAQNGKTLIFLAKLIESDDISLEESLHFVDELVRNGLLKSELDINVTGQEYQFRLQKILEKNEIFADHSKHLNEITSSLRKIDSQQIGSSIKDIKELHNVLKALDIKGVESRMFLQTDLNLCTDSCSLHKGILDQLKLVICFLMRFNRPDKSQHLQSFKEEFYKRYEFAEIPLLEVLDPDIGIGYPAYNKIDTDVGPLLIDMDFRGGGNDFPSARFTSKDKFLTEKLLELARGENLHLDLSKIQLTNETSDSLFKLLPKSLYTVCNVLKFDEKLSTDNYTVLYDHTTGPSASNLLGRFCHSNPELHGKVVDLLNLEESDMKDVIFAEIVHVPQYRHGNILMRPSLREYEIPILAVPGVNTDKTIHLSDIVVSLHGDEIILRSQRLNKRIIPRMSTAHNHSFNSIGSYHFLCDLQLQELNFLLSWDWGALTSQKYLPRVVYKNVVLSPAQWIISLNDFNNKGSKYFNFSDFDNCLRIAIGKLKLAKLVVLSAGDNQIPIDFDNILSREILFEELKRTDSIILKENLFNSDDLIVKTQNASFTNEVIIPWANESGIKLEDHKLMEYKASYRTFSIGSEWLYYKIYCGIAIADKLLIEELNPLLESFLAEGIIEKWFFIRYYDSDYHIRIRFYGYKNFHSHVIDRLHKSLSSYFERRLVWKLQLDTYNRELERYGHLNIQNSETIFFQDSKLVLKVLSLINGSNDMDLRWQFALKGVDDLLTSFGLVLQEKRDMMKLLSTEFKKEFNTDNAEAIKQLSSKYRNLRLKIEMILVYDLDSTHEYYPIWLLFSQRMKEIKPCVEFIKQLIKNKQLEVDLSSLIASYIHMFLNRFLRSKQRMQEMVIYDLLHQHYKSILAREAKA
jgi:lantibiotic biosynthesis protein